MAEIGDKIPSEQDKRYENYCAFVQRTYGTRPADYEKWVRMDRHGCNSSQAQGHSAYIPPVEYKRRQAARAALETLTS